MRLSIFLGHPTYALTVVLFSVLLFSGLGSMVTERIVRSTDRARCSVPLLVLLGAGGRVRPRSRRSSSTQLAGPAHAPCASPRPSGCSRRWRSSWACRSRIGMRAWRRPTGRRPRRSSGASTARCRCAPRCSASSSPCSSGSPSPSGPASLAYVLATVSMWVLIRRLPATTAESTGTDSDADADTEADADGRRRRGRSGGGRGARGLPARRRQR